MNGCANLANHPQESSDRACAGSTEGAHAGSVNIDIIDEVLQGYVFHHSLYLDNCKYVSMCVVRYTNWPVYA